MPLPKENNPDFAQMWRKYYDVLLLEQSRVNFLMTLKERRDVRKDEQAGILLEELTARWVREKWREG